MMAVKENLNRSMEETMEQDKDKTPGVKPETLELADKIYALMQGIPWAEAAKAVLISANRISIQQNGVGLRLTVAPLLDIRTNP